jgi:hypothetical protein
MPWKGAAPIMTDPVEVIAKAICRCSCSVCEPGGSCWDWEAVVPEARAALAALDADGMVVAEANLERELHEAREILADFVRETDEWNTRMMAILGRPPNYCWQTLERARAALVKTPAL